MTELVAIIALAVIVVVLVVLLVQSVNQHRRTVIEFADAFDSVLRSGEAERGYAVRASIARDPRELVALDREARRDPDLEAEAQLASEARRREAREQRFEADAWPRDPETGQPMVPVGADV